MDNLGSYKKIEMIFAKHISSITEDTDGRIRISFQSFAEPVELPFQCDNAEISSVPKRQDAGMLYENNARIIIPEQYLTSELIMKLREASIYGVLIRYETVLEKTYLLGGTEYPLFALVENITPGTATKMVGLSITFSGKSTFSQREVIL